MEMIFMIYKMCLDLEPLEVRFSSSLTIYYLCKLHQNT